MSFFNVPPEQAHKSRHVAEEAAGIQINQGLGLPLLSSIVLARHEGKRHTYIWGTRRATVAGERNSF